MIPSQLVLKSTRSHFGQFVLIEMVNSCSLFGPIRTHFGQFVLILGQLVLMFLINSFSFWDLYFGMYASVSVNGA